MRHHTDSDSSSDSSGSGSDSDSDDDYNHNHNHNSNNNNNNGGAGLLTPPPSNNNQSDRSLSNTRTTSNSNSNSNTKSRSRSTSFSSPLFNVNSRSRSASIISADGHAHGHGHGTPLLTPITPSSNSNNTSRPSSTSRSNTGSRANSRNNNQRRSVTPLVMPLGGMTINRSNVHTYDHDEYSYNEYNGNSPATHSPHMHHPSPSNNTTNIHNNNNSNTNRVLGLGAGLAIGTVIPATQLKMARLTESKREYNNRTRESGGTGGGYGAYKSDKQGPGQRKVRRWNNDKFIGIATDISHGNPMRGSNIANLYAEAEMNRDQYIMPNDYANRHNRTIFSTLAAASATLSADLELEKVSSSSNNKKKKKGLSTLSLEEDDSDVDDDESDDDYHYRNKITLSPEALKNIRDRFIDGEVGQNHNDEPSSSSSAHEIYREMTSKVIYQDGYKMMKHNVDERLYTIVQRACRDRDRNIVLDRVGSASTNTSTSSNSTRNSNFARTIVDVFEKLIVSSLTIGGNDESEAFSLGAGTSGTGTRMYSMSDDAEVWKAILAQKPMVTRKKNASGSESGSTKEQKNHAAVTIRFLFDAEDNSDNNDKGNGSGSGSGSGRGAFHRLLLHAVCQYHGLEASSSTTKRGHRMLTVNGRCRGSQFRFLDHIKHDDDSDGDSGNDEYDDFRTCSKKNKNHNKVGAKKRTKKQAKATSTSTTSQSADETPATQMLLESMAALKVQ